MDKKPIYVSPFNTTMYDGTRPLIYVSRAIFLGTFGFLFGMCLAFFVLWFIPILQVPSNGLSVWFHMKAMLLLFLGKLLPMTQGATYRLYGAQWQWLAEHGQLAGLGIRYVLCLAAGIYASYKLAILGLVPVHMERQIRGKKLLTGQEAFDDLKDVFDKQIGPVGKDGKEPPRGLVLATSKGYRANVPATYTGKVKVINYPDAQRRTHYVILGGSRRGKGVFNKMHVIQIYNKICAGLQYKLMIIDTPKGEYSRLFKKKYFVQVATDEKFAVPHDISHDLLLKQDMAQFAAGLVQVSEKDPFWGTSGRGIVTGIGAFLIAEAGTDWGYNNFAYFKDLPVSELIPIMQKYYPEMNQTMSMGEGPLGSIMGTVSSSCLFMNDVARIWDGYDYKVAIHQMSAALLRKEFWLYWYLAKAFPQTAVIDNNGKDETVEIPYNICTSSILFAHIKALTRSNKNWKWVDLKAKLSEPFAKQVEACRDWVEPAQLFHVDKAYLSQHAANILPIMQYAEIWDGYESRERFSIREWLLDENPAKKIFMLKPSGRFKSQLEGVIRGVLLYMTTLINDKYFPEDKTKLLPVRNLHVFCDEFQSLGNLKEFIGPGLEMFASKGVTIYLSCQDLSQLKEIYGDNFLRFLQANTGNTFIVGTNQGESAELISNALGKKTIMKTHISETQQENGKSTSRNFQQHDGELVMTPDELNSMLGPRGTGANAEIHFLYIPGNVANAYILTTPIVTDYPENYVPEAPAWMSGKGYKPRPYTVDTLKVELQATGGGKKPEEKAPEPVKPTYKYGDAYIDEDDIIQDAASDMTEDDFSPEELDAMEASNKRAERAPLYNLPTEDEGMQGALMKDIAMEALGGSLAKSISHAADIFTEAKRNVTTSKKKSEDAWRMKRDGLDEVTKH